MFLQLITSAVLLNLGYFLPDQFGFVAFYAPVPLFFAIYEPKPGVLRGGLLWSSLIYFPHFLWLLWLLLYKSNAGVLVAIAAYLVVCLGFIIPTTVWIWLNALLFRLMQRVSRFVRFFVFVLSCGLFTFYLTGASLWFLGVAEGYPFGDVRIPGITLQEQPAPVMYLRPDTASHDPGVVGQKIYQQLALVPAGAVVVAPESTFPFALNDHPEVVDMWTSALPDDAHLLIGSQRREGKNYYQTVYWLHEGRIKNHYDKTHRVLFTENVPEVFASMPWAKKLFLDHKTPISAGEQSGVVFPVSESLRILPQMCSELFMNGDVDTTGATIIAWFVNDSWFPSYFKNLMVRLAQRRATQLKRPILYITHEKAVVFNP